MFQDMQSSFTLVCGILMLNFISDSSGELEVVWANATRLDAELVWRPELHSSDYFAIGHYVDRSVETRYGNIQLPNCQEPDCWDNRIPVARATGDELAPPLTFKRVLSYKNLNFWNMECPTNYVALSGVATPNIRAGSSLFFPPDIDRYRCVHENFTERQDLYFYFHANGLNGMWATPVAGRSVGSFFVLSQPDNVTFSATGYSLTSKISEIDFKDKPEVPQVAPLKQAQGTSQPPPLTTTPISDPSAPYFTSRGLIIILGSAAVIASSLVISIVLLVYCLRYKRKTKAMEREMSSNYVTPDFVFKATTRATSSGKEIDSGNPLDGEREMRINMLYGHRV